MPFSIRIKRSPISRSLFSFQREGRAPRFRVPYFRWRKEQPIININGSKKHRGFMSLSGALIFPGEPLAARKPVRLLVRASPIAFLCEIQAINGPFP